ncbi:MAG: PHP domain-containing protein [Pseudomonadota bacterium]
MKFDLHCHSYYSDGQLSPAELLALAKEVGITHLALTDHDTLNGLPDAAAAAQQQQLHLINGVELSCSWNGQLLHVLGLGVDPKNPELIAGIERNTELRLSRAKAMVEDFSRHGIELEEEVNGLLNGAVPTRPHFAEALVNLGYAKNKNQAFKRYLVRGKPGFIPMQWPLLQEVAEWIVGASGTAVLAHPLRYKLTRTKLVRLIEEMQEAGVRAMEVSSANLDLQQVKMLADLAVQHKLLGSVGSDFHALDQPWARLGGARDIPETVTPVWSELAVA